MIKCIHSHFLPNVDDGVDSFEEAFIAFKLASINGIDEMILTPHYVSGSKWNKNNKEKLKIFNDMLKYDLDVKIYLGNEIYLDEDILEHLKNNEVMSLNNSKYLLIELPMNHEIIGYENILLDLINAGYVPIIAHPERYKYDLDYESLIKMGVLFQGNYLSLFNKYGNKSKKVLEELLKKHYIACLGSDAHTCFIDFKGSLLIDYLKEKLHLSDGYIDNITCVNFSNIINNVDISGE